jgi:hypothetical protein
VQVMLDDVVEADGGVHQCITKAITVVRERL